MTILHVKVAFIIAHKERPNEKNVKILQVDTMGKEGEHLRFSFAQEGIVMQGVKFKTKEIFKIGSHVNITYTVNENHFRGKTTLQLMVDKVISNPS